MPDVLKHCIKCGVLLVLGENWPNWAKQACDYRCQLCIKTRMADYQKKNIVRGTSSKGGRDVGRAGAACECLVQSDLLYRNFDVTKPVSAVAEHDLHVELPSVGWKGVQVKAVGVNKKTGYKSWVGGCKSPILALVLLPHDIEYRAGTEPLPEELCQSTNTSAEPAKLA